MKKLTYILFLVATLGLAACNSEDLSYDVDHTAIHPLGGQYVVTVTRNGQNPKQIYATLSNTVDDVANQCWIRIGSYTTTTPMAINGKISCDVNSLSFSGTNVQNLAGNVTSSQEAFTVTDGKVALQGVTAPSGTVTDKISFTYTTTKDPGAVYTVEGWRYTGWPEDDY